MRHGFLTAVAMAATASPAYAQTANFSVGTVEFAVPVPSGYCLPKGADVDRARSMAAFDDYNDSPLTLFSCGKDADPTITLVVKAPKRLVNQRVTLTDVLSSAEFDQGTTQGGAPLDEQLEEVAERETGQRFEVSNAMRGLGRDDVCGYVGGTVKVETVIVSVVVCSTAVGERNLLVIFTAPGGDPAELPKLKARARAFASTIRVR